MSKTNIRRATAQDMPAVRRLVQELADYEKAGEQVTVTVEELVHDGFTLQLFECIVAEHVANPSADPEIVGMVFYYPRYSTWKGRTIHLEDFVVQESHRRSGLGLKLFQALIAEAKRFGAKRLEWHVLDWNEPALAFYEKVGAQIDKGWWLGRLTAEQMERFESEG